VKFNFRDVYTNLFNYVQNVHQIDENEAARLTIGGNFAMYSVIERQLLIQCGLHPEHYLIDVGCGSGRLTMGMAPYLKGRYLGTDVVPELLARARQQAANPLWCFEQTEGISIPETDDQADFVCFFSVFTHLLHEQSYVYLKEAKRVLKPGGRIVFSFTEFANPNHWQCFEAAIAELGMGLPLYVFIERRNRVVGYAAWARGRRIPRWRRTIYQAAASN
jgi:ubiquinone/menaquinone biosynthesis C-methylase UbiE